MAKGKKRKTKDEKEKLILEDIKEEKRPKKLKKKKRTTVEDLEKEINKMKEEIKSLKTAVMELGGNVK